MVATSLPSPELGPESRREIPRGSVWPCAQTDSRAQRKGRYLPESMAHPGKMLPAIAEHAITHYTQPGDLVVDPMAGIGTTLVEAVHADRMALGAEHESRWADLARRNVEHATELGAASSAAVIQGDARDIVRLVGTDTVGKAALVLTSPPYGSSLHGHVRSTRDSGHGGIAKSDFRYSRDPGNLAHRSLGDLFTGFREILEGCYQLHKPGGHLVLTSRPFRRSGEFCDVPGRAWHAAIDAGFEPLERCVALLAGVRQDRLVPGPSFFQLAHTRAQNAAGIPVHLLWHEDVHVLTRLADPAGIQGETAESAALTAKHVRPCRYDRAAASAAPARGGSDPVNAAVWVTGHHRRGDTDHDQLAYSSRSWIDEDQQRRRVRQGSSSTVVRRPPVSCGATA